MRTALALATCVQVSASSTRAMAERQAAALGRGAMGSPRPSACSEKGVQTAPAKSPPRPARPTTACWAPFMPPGRGAKKATAVTTRTISQAPNPQRPVRAVSTTPATVCQSSRKPASSSTPPLKTNSMSPSTACRATSTSLRKPSRSRVALSVAANRSGSMVWAPAGPAISPPAPTATRPRPEAASPAPSRARGRRSRSSRCRQRHSPRAAGERPGTPSKSARTFPPNRLAARPTSPTARPSSGANRKRSNRMVSLRRRPGSARPGRRRISSAASARRAASMAPRRSSSRNRSQSSMSEIDCSIASSRSRFSADISCSATNLPGSSKRRLASSSMSS